MKTMTKVLGEGILYHDKAWEESCMSRVEILIDDGRTFSENTAVDFDQIIEYGRKYRVTMIVEEIL